MVAKPDMTAQGQLCRIGIVALMHCFASCGGEFSRLDDLDQAVFETLPSYDLHIAPLLNKACVSCHDAHGLIAGGVELDRYETAFDSRLKNVCTAVTPIVIERFSHVLRSVRQDPLEAPCSTWKAFSMPKGAKSRMTLFEQVLFARWVEIGAPP
jgi:hypothetical protein